MVYEYKETDPIDVTLLQDRIVGLYAVPLDKCWWDAGGVHAHDGEESNRVYGVLSKESLKNLQFEMKGTISTDPLSDLLKPLVKSAEKWAQNKFQILRMLKGDNNSAAENIMSVINNLYMVGKVSAAEKENEKGGGSSLEAVNFRAPVLQVPVYDAVPGVSLNLSSPITILFQYGFNAENITTIKESFDVKTCVLNKLSTVQKLLPKLTINKDRAAGDSWQTASFTTTFPTQAHFISALFSSIGDAKDKGVTIYKEVLNKAKSLVAPSANDKSSVEQVYTQISNKLADNIKKIDSTIDKSISTEDLMAYIYDKGDDYKGLSDYVPESFTNEKGDLKNDGSHKSYFSYAREMFEKFSDLSKATPKTYKNPINDPTSGISILGANIGGDDQAVKDVSPSKVSKKLSDADKVNIGNSPLYEYVNNQGSNKLTELLEDIVAVKDKISASILDNLEGNALYLEAFGGHLVIGPFLAEQISWSYDMSVVDDNGYPLAGSVKIQKLVSILPGTGAVRLSY